MQRDHEVINPPAFLLRMLRLNWLNNLSQLNWELGCPELCFFPHLLPRNRRLFIFPRILICYSCRVSPNKAWAMERKVSKQKKLKKCKYFFLSFWSPGGVVRKTAGEARRVSTLLGGTTITFTFVNELQCWPDLPMHVTFCEKLTVCEWLETRIRSHH